MHSKQSVFIYKDDLLRFVPNPVSQGAALEPQGWAFCPPLTPYLIERKKEAQVEENTHASFSFYGKNVIL